jgi:hypothetical protein
MNIETNPITLLSFYYLLFAKSADMFRTGDDDRRLHSTTHFSAAAAAAAFLPSFLPSFPSLPPAPLTHALAFAASSLETRFAKIVIPYCSYFAHENLAAVQPSLA